MLPKGEICKKTGRLLKRFGYDVRVLDLKKHDKSHGYNPFEYFRSDDDILMFANNMWEAMEDKTASRGDPTWPELARAMLLSFMLYLFHYAPPDEQNFDMVVELMHKVKIDDEKGKAATVSELDNLFDRIPHDDTAYGYYKDWSTSSGRTLASIYVTLSAKLSVFNLESMRKLTFKDEMGILDLADKKVAIFMVIPDDTAVYNFLAGTLYTQMFQQLYDYADGLPSGALPQHVRFYMDEFANIALPNDYQRILATARSRNMSFVIVLQDKQQIEAIFEKHYKSILSNCNFRLFLGTNEIETCEYFSKFLGKETITVASETKNYGKGGGSSRNESKTGRELMTADELLKLSKRKCVIYIPGESACMDFKEDMTRHKYYRYIADGIRTWKNGYDWGEDNITHGKMQLLDNDYLGDIRSIEGSDSDGWKIIDPE
ncbi:MAG: type IV secretory system conjugative DNA transfer family protein [Eubacterium sp.]|nr:type IV secretory system conjugative DNA transfer family protein [Eubacterium sp.]